MDLVNVGLLLVTFISLLFNFHFIVDKKRRKKKEEEEDRNDTKQRLRKKQGFAIVKMPEECRRINEDEDVEDIDSFAKKLRQEVDRLIGDASFREEMGDSLFVVYFDKKKDGTLRWEKGEGPIDPHTYHQRDYFDLTKDLEDRCKGAIYFVHALGNDEIYIKYNPIVLLKGKNQIVKRNNKSNKTAEKEEKEKEEEEEEEEEENRKRNPVLTLSGGKGKGVLRRRDIRIELENPVLTVQSLYEKGKTLEFKMKNKKYFLFDSGAFDYEVAIGVTEGYVLAQKNGFKIYPHARYKGELVFGPEGERRCIKQNVQFVDHNADALDLYILGNSSFLMDNHFFYDASTKVWNFFEKGESCLIKFDKSPQPATFTNLEYHGTGTYPI